MIDEIIEFILSIFGTFNGLRDSLSSFFRGFAEFGIGRATEDVQQFCVENAAECGSAEPIIQLFGFLYVIARYAPTFLVVFILARSYFDDWTKGVITAVIYQISSIVLFSFILGLRPNPFEVFEKVSTGPVVLLETVRWSFSISIVEAFTTWFIIFGSFFAMSFLMWYIVNFLLWFITLTFKKQPIFSETSAKGHALWLTVTWIFYLTMEEPFQAFINTLFILVIIIGNRSWQNRESSGSSDSIDEEKLVEIMDSNEEVEEPSDNKIQWE